MAAIVQVFCKKPVPQLDAAMVNERADLLTLAELIEPTPEDEEAAVAEMREQFRIEGTTLPLEIYWSKEFRALQLSKLDPETMKACVAEMLDELADEDEPGAVRVKEYIAQTRELIHFEFGFGGADHFGGPLVEELAYAIAEAGDSSLWFWRRSFGSATDRVSAIWESKQ
jgi:hypothetical protein